MENRIKRSEAAKLSEERGPPLFSGFGFGLWNRLSWVESWALALTIMFVMALAFMAWLRLFRMGPLEWAWRCLTFGRAPESRGE